MIKLDCSGVTFYSQLDECNLFEWGSKIEAFIGWERDLLVLNDKLIDEHSLRDIIALFWRYQIPMKQLARFETTENSSWFRARNTYWHGAVFGNKCD